MLTFAFWQKVETGQLVSSFHSLRLRNLITVAVLVATVLLLVSFLSSQTYGLHGHHYFFAIFSILLLSGSYGFEVHSNGIKVKYLFFYKWVAFKIIRSFKEESNQVSKFAIALFDSQGKNVHLNFDSNEQVNLFKSYLESVKSMEEIYEHSR